MNTYNITKRKRPKIQSNGKVKRTGKVYYELAYWEGFWKFKDFDTLKEAKQEATK